MLTADCIAVGDQHVLNQDTIDAGADTHHALLRLEVDVAGAVVNGAGDDLAHQPDDGRVLVLVGQPAEDLLQRLGHLLVLFLEDLVNGFADGLARAVVKLQAVENVPLRRGDQVNMQPCHLLQSVNRRDVERVGQRDGQGAVLPGDGHRDALPRHLHRQRGQHPLVHANLV